MCARILYSSPNDKRSHYPNRLRVSTGDHRRKNNVGDKNVFAVLILRTGIDDVCTHRRPTDPALAFQTGISIRSRRILVRYNGPTDGLGSSFRLSCRPPPPPPVETKTKNARPLTRIAFVIPFID